MSQDERQRVREGLVQLKKLADILPAIKRLDGEIVRVNNHPMPSDSRHHEIWRGLWQNQIDVSLISFLFTSGPDHEIGCAENSPRSPPFAACDQGLSGHMVLVITLMDACIRVGHGP